METIGLHDIIQRMHVQHPSTTSLSLLNYSNTVQAACERFATETSVDIGNFNRLKFLVHLFQSKNGDECKCSQVGTDCYLFLFRSFLSCGGYNFLTSLLFADRSNNVWMVLGNSVVQQAVHGWCLNLLWLLTLPSSQVFQRCWGGSAFQMTIVSHVIVRSGLKQEAEYTISIDSCIGVKLIKKKLPLVVTFLEQMQVALKDVITLPVLPARKGSVQEVAEQTKASANTVFEFLCLPIQFYRMFRIDAARNLMTSFVDVDIRPVQPTKEALMRHVPDYVSMYQEAYAQKRSRNMSGMEFHSLFRILVGGAAIATADVVDDPDAVSQMSYNFAISGGFKEPWILSHILAAVPTTSDEFAVGFLNELAQYFSAQPQVCSKLIMEEPFTQWLFPIFFDHALDKGDDVGEFSEGDFRRQVVCEIAIDMLAGAIVHELITRVRKKEESKNDFRATAEGLFASTLASIGCYDMNRAIVPWSKRSVEIVQALGHGVGRRLVHAAPTFRGSWRHPAWNNLMEVFNVFRNMAWCCVVPGSGNEAHEVQVVRSLIQTSNAKLPSAEMGRVLLSEHIVASLRDCCRSLNLFDLGNPDDTAADTKLVQALKGSGFAFTSFFRECLPCIRNLRNRSPEEQAKMMSQFVSTHVFKRAYVKEEEDRLTLIHDTETRRRNTMTRPGEDPSKQIVRDLETLAAGVTVWQIPKRGNVQQCYLYLKSQASVAQAMQTSKSQLPIKSSAYTIAIECGRDKLSLTLFEQATLELGVNDPKLLSKHNFEHAMDMGLALWKDKECRQFICTSIEDYQCCSRVLSYLRAQRIETTTNAPPTQTFIVEKKDFAEKEITFPLDMGKVTLHEMLILVHQYNPSAMNSAMLSYSSKANSSTSRDLGDLNRLRFLVHLIEGDCAQTPLPCRSCYQTEKAHETSSCQYFSFIDCFCHKSIGYQGANSTECLCHKDTNDCVLSTAKSFIAHGGKELLQNMLRDKARPWFIHRWCFHLLWLLSNLNPSNFDKCWGGTYVKVTIESFNTVRGGLKSETEFVFIVDLPLCRKKLTKKMAEVTAFQEQLTMLLKGTVDLTGLSKPKGVNTEVPATLQASMNTIFQFFSAPEKFQMLARVGKARDLFYDFFVISVNAQKLSRAVFAQVLTDYIPIYRENRTMSGSVVRLLFRLMAGDSMIAALDLIDNAQQIPRDESFSVTKIADIWLMPYVLRALPAVSDEVAVLILRELNHFYLRQPVWSKEVLGCVDYVTWFFPLFFDRYSNESKASVRSSWDCFNLGINLLCVIQSNLILATHFEGPVGGELNSSAEMVANTVQLIGMFDGQSLGQPIPPWSKINVDIVQAVLASIMGKLSAAVSSFRNLLHPAWTNIVNVLSVYRNMTWCCTLSSSMVRLLLTQGPPPIARAGEPARSLLSEQVLVSVRGLLNNLHIFEITADALDGQENIQINFIKGAVLAHWGYFRDCLACVQTAKEYSSEDQEKLMALFLQTYPFDPTFNKEEEQRLMGLAQNENRRKRSLMRAEGGTRDLEKQQQRDFQVCHAGLFAWKLPNKKGGKAEGCFLYLRNEEEKLWRGGGMKDLVTVQTQHKKESFALFEKGTLSRDPNMSKTGLEFVRHDGFVIWQGNDRTDLVCATQADTTALSDCLAVLQARRLQRDSGPKLDLGSKSARSSNTEGEGEIQEKSTVELHAVFAAVHEVFGNSVSAAMLAFSNAVESAFTQQTADLALWNRLRFLVNMLQVGCDQFSPPCRTCGKAEKVHGAGSQCTRYGASEDSGVCVCGKPAGMHPWAQNIPRECRCGSRDVCPLFPMKMFIARGGKDFLLRTLNDVSRPAYLQRWCLHLLWLWCQVPVASFDRCWGGTQLTVSVDSHTSVRVGIKHETEFLLALEGSLGTHLIRKKQPALLAFVDGLKEALKGTVDVPGLNVLKGNAAEVADELRSGANAVFQVLNTPDNFNKMLRVDKARALFFEFAEVDLHSLQVLKITFQQYVSQFTLAYREEFVHKQTRQMPPLTFQYLLDVLVGTPLLGSSEIIADAPSSASEVSPTRITKLVEPWLLSYLLPSVPTVPVEFGLHLFTNLDDLFKQQTLVRSSLMIDDSFVAWTLPVLFDSEDGKTEERKELMELALDLISTGIAYETFNRRVTKRAELRATDQIKATVDGLLAITIVQIGTFADARDTIWSSQHICVVQALVQDVMEKLASNVMGLKSSLQHPGWGNILDLLNVCRHLAFCPVIPNPIPNETQDMQVVRLLLSPNVNMPGKNLGSEVWKVLLSEHVLSTVCQMLSSMNFFELVAADKSSDEANRLKALKGTGLGLMEFFRGCLACFRTARGSPMEETTLITQFVSTVVLNKNYSKDVEGRLKAQEDADLARKMTIITSRTAACATDAPATDLEHLARGVGVWLVPRKGKLQQFYLYLKRDETSKGTKPVYILVLETQITRKRTQFAVPQEATLEMGTNDANLLSRHGLIAANSAGLILTQGKSKTDLVCIFWDDYASWTRVIPTFMNEQSPRNRRMAIPPSTPKGALPPSTPKGALPPTPKGALPHNESEKPAPLSRPAPLSPRPDKISSGTNFAFDVPGSPRQPSDSIVGPQPRPPTSPRADRLSTSSPPNMYRAQSFVNTAPTTPDSRSPRPPSTPKLSLESPLPTLQRTQSFVHSAPVTPTDRQSVSSSRSPVSFVRVLPAGTASEKLLTAGDAPPLAMQRTQSFVHSAPVTPTDKQSVSSRSPVSLVRVLPMGTASEKLLPAGDAPPLPRTQSFVHVAPTSPESRAPPRSPSTTPLAVAPPRPPPRSKP